MEYQTFFKVNKLCSQAYKDHMRGLQCVLRGIYDWYMTLVGHRMCWISQNCLKVSKTLCQKISNSYEKYCMYKCTLTLNKSGVLMQYYVLYSNCKMTRVYHSTLEPERMLEDSKYIAGAAAPKFFLRVVKSRQNSIKSSTSSIDI